MLRRTFLLDIAAATATRTQVRDGGGFSLGLLAYVQEGTLWLRSLPDGDSQRLATGRNIWNPRFSPSGEWISFQDGDRPYEGGDRIRVISIDGREESWNAGSSELLFGRGVTITPDRRRYAYELEGQSGSKLFVQDVTKDSKPNLLAETAGSFVPFAFTQTGDRLLFWMSEERSASILADGQELYIISLAGGTPRKLGLFTLIHEDMVSLTPAGNVLAVSNGGRREAWANKRIAVADLDSGPNPAIRYLTDPSMSALYPAWSPDEKKLAFSAGPDADALNKQLLLARGQKTIRVITPNGNVKEIPITPELQFGAPQNVVEQCLRQRRIWLSEPGTPGQAKQLTNDSLYRDEEPVWSRDGSHILFCRIDAKDAKTIWLMREDGSDLRQVAGPLTPQPGLPLLESSNIAGSYYGYTPWRNLFDYWRG